MDYINVKTLADLQSVKAAALTEYRVLARIGACTFVATHHKRNGKACITFKTTGGRRSSFSKLAEIVGYL